MITGRGLRELAAAQAVVTSNANAGQCSIGVAKFDFAAEDGDELHLLRGVPRAWLNNGKRIDVAGAATYFGTLSFTVESCAKEGLITAEITCTPDRAPKKIVVSLPHPEGLRAKTVTGGEYEADRERVTITEFPGKASICARF